MKIFLVKMDGEEGPEPEQVIQVMCFLLGIAGGIILANFVYEFARRSTLERCVPSYPQTLPAFENDAFNFTGRSRHEPEPEPEQEPEPVEPDRGNNAG